MNQRRDIELHGSGARRPLGPRERVRPEEVRLDPVLAPEGADDTAQAAMARARNGRRKRFS